MDFSTDLFEVNGFAIARSVLSIAEIGAIAAELPDLRSAAGTRGLLALEPFRRLANDPRLMDLVVAAHGVRGRPVRGILFDKSPDVNWTLGWHQDKKIAVAERFDVDGFHAWSVKEGVVHCQPPVEILAGMVALRIAVDRNGVDNGPLLVIPGSHRHGLLDSSEMAGLTQAAPVACLTEPGDVMVMHPLTLHASGRVTSASRRRVVHLEYATVDLPGPLKWAPT